MRVFTCWMIGGLLIAGTAPAHSQNPTPLPASRPLRFQSWTPLAPATLPIPSTARPAALHRQRGRNALIGGVIGATAGLAVCTVISNLVNDDGAGFSTCTRKGYLLFGGVGFALGLVVGFSV
jgi:hypothetical protein